MALVKLGSVQSVTPVVSGYVNLATDCSTSILPVANGGSGSGSFTDGQLLVGNTTGNTLTKATLTGTANQVIVTNGHGSITLSLPQDIGTSSTPTFSTLTLSGQLDTPSIVHSGTISITPTSGNDVDINTAAGAYLHVTSTLGGGIKLERSTVNDAGTSLVFDTGGSNKWGLGPQGDGTEDFKLFNNTTTGTAFTVSNATNVMDIAALAATNAVFTTPNIGTPSAGVLTNCTGLPVVGGGTGQSSYTDGQLLIGNTTGNTLTKSTLTGTANQVVVTNGSGSITLSLPQSIGTGSSPQFLSIGLNQAASSTAVITASKNYTDPAGSVFQANFSSTSNSITSTSSTAIFIGVQTDTRVNQGSFNLSNSAGIRTLVSNAIATGSSGTVTGLSAGYFTCGNTGAGTVTNAYTYQCIAGVNSGGGTVTNWHGFNVMPTTAGTNIYGFRGQIASTSGRWNLYMDGTAANYVAGELMLGTSTSGSAQLTFGDAKDVAVGSTTGTKIATATTQKLGFYNATPIVQRSGAAQAAVATTASTQTTPWGYSTQAQADAIITLLNELRAWAVAQGFIKGSA